MARTLYLPDGSTEYVFGDPEEVLQKIIYERLGRDCEELFTEIISELKGMDGEIMKGLLMATVVWLWML